MSNQCKPMTQQGPKITFKACPPCNQWCPDKSESVCCNEDTTSSLCAAPAMHSGQWDIGSRQCCGGHKKCTDLTGKKFCSHTGSCPDSQQLRAMFSVGQSHNYSDFAYPVRENFRYELDKKLYGVF
jgi:hypothetical protein